MGFQLIYKPYGERSILIVWQAVIDKEILFDVLAFKNKILNSDIKLIVNVNSVYNSLLISYMENIVDFNEQVITLKEIYNQKQELAKTVFKQWKIPVCYDTIFGIDLGVISKTKSITTQNIIERHSQAVYTVYCIGFLPGFLYLGGLDEMLHVPRKETPRLKINKGSVAIGGKQTGVYPSESPGGWHIIGNTPISFFDVSKNNPCFAKPGDEIKFYPVSIETYHDIKTQVDAGVYQLESKMLHG